MQAGDRLSPFFDPLPVLVLILDQELEVCFANRLARSMLRLEEGVRWLERLHPDDREPVRRGLENVRLGHGVWSRTCRAGHGDSWSYWLQVEMRPFTHTDVPQAAIEVIASDVTSLVLAQGLSEERQGRLTLLSNLAQTVAGESSESVLVERCRSVLSTLLPVASVVLLLPSEERDQSALYQAASSPDAPPNTAWQALQRVEPGSHPVWQVWEEAFPRVDTMERILGDRIGEREQAVLLPLLAGGQVVGVLVTALSEHVELAIEDLDLLTQASILIGGAVHLAHTVRALDKQRLVAEHASRLKSEFLANTSHELRTPLTGILGFLRLVIEGADPDSSRQYVELAHRSGEKLLMIINEVLDLARIEADRLEMAPTTVSLAHVFAEIGVAFRQQMVEAGLHFAIQPPAEPISFYADRNRTVQVLTNLVSNALKFTRESGHVEISAATEDGCVVITVRDDGRGIEHAELERIFDSFYQVDGSMTRGVGGTGLGLTISQRLAEMMGGRLELSSAGVGRGTTAYLRLPLAAQPEMSTGTER